MFLDKINNKSKISVIDIFWSKHSFSHTMEPETLHDYKVLPEFIDLDITPDYIKKVVFKYSDSAEPGGTDILTL